MGVVFELSNSRPCEFRTFSLSATEWTNFSVSPEKMRDADLSENSWRLQSIFMNRTQTGFGTSTLTPVGANSPVDWFILNTITFPPDWFAASMYRPVGSMA